jgi:hypothetical protein
MGLTQHMLGWLAHAAVRLHQKRTGCLQEEGACCLVHLFSSPAYLGGSLEGIEDCIRCNRGSQRHHAARQQLAIHSHVGRLTQGHAARGQPQAPAAREHLVKYDRDASAAALLQQRQGQADLLEHSAYISPMQCCPCMMHCIDAAVMGA